MHFNYTSGENHSKNMRLINEPQNSNLGLTELETVLRPWAFRPNPTSKGCWTPCKIKN